MKQRWKGSDEEWERKQQKLTQDVLAEKAKVTAANQRADGMKTSLEAKDRELEALQRKYDALKLKEKDWETEKAILTPFKAKPEELQQEQGRMAKGQ
jgi:hypothetical protein